MNKLMMLDKLITPVTANIISDFLENVISDEVKAIGFAVGFIMIIVSFILLSVGGKHAETAKTRLLYVAIGIAGLAMSPQIYAWFKTLG